MTFLSDNPNILITGGTGSFGKAFISEILEKYPNLPKVVIYSRDELKQWEMQQQFPQDRYPNLRFLLGDVRDKERLSRALEQIDLVIHSAALKQVPAAEYNPMEFIRTNILGAENIIQASLDNNVKKIIALSTDKAAAPVNLYGATKLCSDKLFIAANNIVGNRDLTFSVVRYGNVMGSRGSVIPFFLEKAKHGSLPITHKEMTRFNITLKEGVNMVLWAIDNSKGGEIFVPKLPSYRVVDLAFAIGPNCKKEYNGTRPGEKIHEEMITSSDSINTFDFGEYYAIIPEEFSGIVKNTRKIYFEEGLKFNKVEENFSYSSGNNPNFLDIDSIRTLIKNNIDKDFKPF